MANVLVADDHPLVREALRSAISQVFPDSVTLEASSLDEAVAIIAGHPDLDLVLLDLNMPGTAGFAGLLVLRRTFPKLPVVVVSGLDDRRIIAEALGYGAAGFIPKSSPKTLLAEGIREAMEGNVFVPPAYREPLADQPGRATPDADLARRIATLTPQQLRVLKLVSEGKLNKQIAFELGIGETTVKAHVSAILHKLGVYSRTQAAIEARKLAFDQILSDGNGGEAAWCTASCTAGVRSAVTTRPGIAMP
jgi:DNA-binding NarL/FixJ family response regulator